MSRNLLDKISVDGCVFVRNMPWQGSEAVRLPTQVLAANVLCKKHNEELSPLDAVAGRFFEHIHRINDEFVEGVGGSWLWGMNGHDLERWMLKALCGMVAGKTARTSDGAPFPAEVPPDWVRILYGLRTFPPSWGLYVDGQLGKRSQIGTNQVHLDPISVDGSIVGVTALLAGVTWRLILRDVPARRTGAIDASSICRPGYVAATQADVQKVIYFHWDQPSERHGIELFWQPPGANCAVAE